jgi:hypothetical protein
VDEVDILVEPLSECTEGDTSGVALSVELIELVYVADKDTEELGLVVCDEEREKRGDLVAYILFVGEVETDLQVVGLFVIRGDDDTVLIAELVFETLIDLVPVMEFVELLVTESLDVELLLEELVEEGLTEELDEVLGLP